MAAFTAYPMLGAGDEPAATSHRIITEILRQELGFTGVVTTDNMEMRGLLDRYEMGEAALRAIEAGCDLILCRSEAPVGFHMLTSVREAVREGRLSEARLDESVQRILRMRWDMGLAEAGGLVDPEAADLFDDPQVSAPAMEAAERTVTVLRDDARVLPLRPGQRVLLIEQAHHFHSFINEDLAAVRARLAAGGHDVVVTTSYYNYRSGATMVPLLDEVLAAGKPVVVVANTPYRKFGLPEQVSTGIVSYCPSGRENLDAVARVLYGKLKASATLGIGAR